MSKMNLGLEALVSGQAAPVEFTEDMYVDMQIAEEELGCALAELKTVFDSFESFTTLLDVLQANGSYAGFEELIADKAQLDSILGFDICTASAEQLKDLYSNETVADVLNKFFAKVNAFFGRIGDRINNFFKTLLPYKEKYLKELVELKQILQNRSFDEKKFAGMKVASALKKSQYNDLTTALKKSHDAIVKAVNYASDQNIEEYLENVNEIPGTIRTSLFGTTYWRPYLSWFKSSTPEKMEFKTKDVAGVINDYIEIINGIVDLQGLFGKVLSNISSLEQKQSFTRASGETAKAEEIRKAIENLRQFWFTLLDSIYAYEGIVRRGMYFATYLGRAAKQCIKND